MGITELPQTWDELRLVAKKLTDDTNGDIRVDRYGLLLHLGKDEAFGLDFSVIRILHHKRCVTLRKKNILFPCKCILFTVFA